MDRVDVALVSAVYHAEIHGLTVAGVDVQAGCRPQRLVLHRRFQSPRVRVMDLNAFVRGLGRFGLGRRRAGLAYGHEGALTVVDAPGRIDKRRHVDETDADAIRITVFHRDAARAA